MEVFRTYSPELVNLYIRHPSVRPHVQEGAGLPDSRDAVTNGNNIFLASEVGVVIFIRCGEEAWDAHIVVIADGRGKQALALGREAMRQIFVVYGAAVCYADIALPLRGNRWFARQCGFTSLGADPEEGVEYFIAEADKWASNS